jgi:hypothetical protein
VSIAIVSTSIHSEPDAYVYWARQGDLIVAGDRNTSRDLLHFVNDIGGQYLTPHDQEHWAFSDDIGWHTIQRRNAAIMQAYVDGYDFIMTVDDDNFPASEILVEEHAKLIGTAPLTVKETYILDIGKSVVPQVRQRGVPLGRTDAPVRYTANFTNATIAVSQCHILGDPDCDAITRITEDPTVSGVLDGSFTVAPHTWCPFNSQATLWDGTLAPLMAVLPGEVDRHDDIWAAYIAERIFPVLNVALHVGNPHVHQRRNHHDPINDLRREMYGLERTYTLLELLSAKYLAAHWPLPEMYSELADAIRSVLPTSTYRFMKNWAKVWGENER